MITILLIVIIMIIILQLITINIILKMYQILTPVPVLNIAAIVTPLIATEVATAVSPFSAQITALENSDTLVNDNILVLQTAVVDVQNQATLSAENYDAILTNVDERLLNIEGVLS